MKAITFLLLVSVFSFSAGAQTDSATTANTDTATQAIDTVPESGTGTQSQIREDSVVANTIRNTLIIAPHTLDTVFYGLISMTNAAKTGTVPVFRALPKEEQTNKKKEESVNITVYGIEVVIEEWHITRCLVRTSMGTFQSRFPISLLFYNQGRYKKSAPRRNDLLFYRDDKNRIFKLRLGSVLNFDPSALNRVSMETYSLKLDKDTQFAKPLIAVPTADNIINFSVFTDVVGLFGEANGLVQFEADAYIPLNHGNIQNRNWFVLRGIRPYFDLIRMDKEFQTIDVRDDISDGMLADTTFPKMFRQAYLRGGFDLNVMTSTTGTNVFNAFIGTEFRQSRLLIRDNDKQSANMISAYTGVNFATRAFDNFRISGDSRLYFLSRLIQTHDYRKEGMVWLISSVTLSYHPPFRPQSKIFLRLNYNFYATTSGNDFVQLQMGYKTPLSSKVKTNVQ
ncbi:MAG: hypothetical protein WC756_01955 [Taibaiella sp.]